MVQVAQDLVVVNQLRPYPTFDQWRPTILEAVSLYRELAKPKSIRSVGVRYINRIEIPGLVLEMQKYFGLYAEIPEALGGSHGPFMIRVEIPSKSLEHRMLVTFGTAPPKKSDHSSFALDLYDKSEAATFETLPEVVDGAHENIERAFEAILTDSTRSLFEDGT